jgi:acyl-CoA thioester hydrolase
MRNDPRRHSPAAYPWHVSIQTRFDDMDVNRHLNNVAYARLFEETRVRFHWALRSGHPEVGHPRFLIARVEIDYLAEGTYPRAAEMALAVLSVGQKSYRVGLGLFQKDRCVALSDAVMVLRNPEGGTMPITPELRAALESYALAA